VRNEVERLVKKFQGWLEIPQEETKITKEAKKKQLMDLLDSIMEDGSPQTPLLSQLNTPPRIGADTPTSPIRSDFALEQPPTSDLLRLPLAELQLFRHKRSSGAYQYFVGYFPNGSVTPTKYYKLAPKPLQAWAKIWSYYTKIQHLARPHISMQAAWDETVNFYVSQWGTGWLRTSKPKRVPVKPHTKKDRSLAVGVYIARSKKANNQWSYSIVAWAYVRPGSKNRYFKIWDIAKTQINQAWAKAIEWRRNQELAVYGSTKITDKTAEETYKPIMEAYAAKWGDPFMEAWYASENLKKA